MRSALLCTTAVALCLYGAPASAQQAITTPILTTDGNFRDLAGIAASMGGTGYVNPTSHGGWARTGVFYRSEALSVLNAGDQAYLSSLNIGLVVDLRTGSEIAGPPSWPFAPNAGADLPIGAVEYNANIYGGYFPTSPDTTNSATAIASMKGIYQAFVSDPTQRNGFRDALLALAHEDDAALYHCSGGKDRTGWTSALLQTIAGVSLATIKSDYVASNAYLAPFIDAIVGGLPPLSDQAIMLRALLGVQADYLEAGLTQVNSQYGSIDAYLKQGLGLTQEDIYVLRAKMVYYQSLPGQSGFVGNAAAGAAFLNALQNSPLSGRYTSFNYYLQSAIDAGALGSVEAQVGGQVHADTAAFLLRQPLWIEEATALHASGRDLDVGRTRLWMAALGGYFKSDARAGIASSAERSAGTVVGATHRIDAHASVHVGVGYHGGSVASAGATAEIDTALATFGGRYGLANLEAGPYVAARAHIGWVDERSKRSLGGGLGTAEGHTSGAVASTRADIGNVIRWARFTITPQLGVRVSHVSLGSFTESGSDVALNIDRNRQTSSSVLADLDVGLDPLRLDDWTMTPSVTLGYERVLGHAAVDSNADLYGFAVGQTSAYDSRNLVKAGLAFTARREAFTVKAGVNAVRGDGASTGINAQLSVGYRF